MQYFDLNIPYQESDPGKKAHPKTTRLTTTVRSLELGYTGIAYNRTIRGVMSESDRCTIPPFPPSTLRGFSSSLSSSVAFHRRLLGVPEKAPFRQYTRMTFVDSGSQSSALNASNPVLKSYDLVAVRPLNQLAFDHACRQAQVDLISIDFGERMGFRLKLPMVKEAIKRGVFFEITYTGFMEGAEVKRQLISNAKLLVQWTNGKNLIVSSGAPSFLEVRGPNDVSNLLSLVGLTHERAKATISKNCRLLIASALRKRQFYKEAIRVEGMPAGAQGHCKEPWIVDYLNWDPLSSGEGDVLLDDLAKSFAEVGNVSQTVKAIDFTSLLDRAPSHGLQASQTGFRIAGEFNLTGNVVDSVSTSKDLKAPKETRQPQIEPTSLPSSTSLLDNQAIAAESSEFSMCPDSSKESLSDKGKFNQSAGVVDDVSNSHDMKAQSKSDKPQKEPISLCRYLLDQQDHAVEASDQLMSPIFPRGSANVEGSILSSAACLGVGELEKPDALKANISPVRLNEPDMLNSFVIPAENSMVNEHIHETTSRDVGFHVECCATTREEDLDRSGDLSHDGVLSDREQLVSDLLNRTGTGVLPSTHDLVVSTDANGHADRVTDVDYFVERNSGDCLKLDGLQQLEDVAKQQERGDPHADKKMGVDLSIEKNSAKGVQHGDLSHLEGMAKGQEQNEEHHTEHKTDTKVSRFADMMQVDSFPLIKDDNELLLANSMLRDELMMDSIKQPEEFGEANHQTNKAGSHKVKWSGSSQVIRFPFKRFLHDQFKKKGRKSKYKTKKR